jgi:hypothetical protein
MVFKCEVISCSVRHARPLKGDRAERKQHMGCSARLGEGNTLLMFPEIINRHRQVSCYSPSRPLSQEYPTEDFPQRTNTQKRETRRG